MDLFQLRAGERAEIVQVLCEEKLALRLSAMNIRAGSVVRVLRRAPLGSLMVEAEGTRAAIRPSLARHLLVRRLP